MPENLVEDESATNSRRSASSENVAPTERRPRRRRSRSRSPPEVQPSTSSQQSRRGGQLSDRCLTLLNFSSMVVYMDDLLYTPLYCSQRERLEDMLRDLAPDRTKVGSTMVWCLEHADAAQEIVDCVAESLSLLQTPLPKKVCRISHLIHPTLYNLLGLLGNLL